MVRRTDALLLGALTAGILVALAGLVEDGATPLSDTTAARVNGVAIPTDELWSLLERRSPDGTRAERLRAALEDMIDEELLIQRALELGLLRRDSSIRVATIDAMKKAILSEAGGQAVSDGELEAFYRENTALFREPRQLQVDELIVVDPDDAVPLARRLREGARARDLAASVDSATLARLPPVPLSLEALARRYPREVIDRLQSAGAGDVLAHTTERATRLIQVINVLEAVVPPFDEVRLSVLNEVQMQRQDSAYDGYLAWLRQRADIRRNERLEAPAPPRTE